jgi:hypothetical protein
MKKNEILELKDYKPSMAINDIKFGRGEYFLILNEACESERDQRLQTKSNRRVMINNKSSEVIS